MSRISLSIFQVGTVSEVFNVSAENRIGVVDTF